MLIGDKAKWWNHDIRIGRIGLIVLFVLAVSWIAPYFFDAARNLAWGTSHHWTASYRGRSLKLPVMWRQEEIPHGQAAISLTRARWGNIFLFERILIKDYTTSPVDPEKMMQGLRKIESGIGSINIDVFVPRKNEVAARYMCIASSQPQRRRLRIDCVSKDGKWIAVLDGGYSNITDFESILRNLSEMGDPLPL